MECKLWHRAHKTGWTKSINRNILECKCKFYPVPGIIPTVLIETYWNVNVALWTRLASYGNRINRNILECKFHYASPPSGFCGCINRNILECKYKYQANITEGETVLIETYWNVNVNFHHGTIHSRSVLIETYWNVNYHNQEQSYWYMQSINRNILECKFS